MRVLIFAVAFLFSGSVFAQSECVKNAITKAGVSQLKERVETALSTEIELSEDLMEKRVQATIDTENHLAISMVVNTTGFIEPLVALLRCTETEFTLIDDVVISNQEIINYIVANNTPSDLEEILRGYTTEEVFNSQSLSRAFNNPSTKEKWYNSGYCTIMFCIDVSVFTEASDRAAIKSDSSGTK